MHRVTVTQINKYDTKQKFTYFLFCEQAKEVNRSLSCFVGLYGLRGALQFRLEGVTPEKANAGCGRKWRRAPRAAGVRRNWTALCQTVVRRRFGCRGRRRPAPRVTRISGERINPEAIQLVSILISHRIVNRRNVYSYCRATRSLYAVLLMMSVYYIYMYLRRGLAEGMFWPPCLFFMAALQCVADSDIIFLPCGFFSFFSFLA